jgi:hypothetical protein
MADGIEQALTKSEEEKAKRLAAEAKETERNTLWFHRESLLLNGYNYASNSTDMDYISKRIGDEYFVYKINAEGLYQRVNANYAFKSEEKEHLIMSQ